MDIFLFPSLFEGLAVSLIEAQAAGLNVFASDIKEIRKAKMSNNFELISLDKKEDEWAQIILDKIEDENEREKRKNKIEECGFNIKCEAKKLERYFERD